MKFNKLQIMNLVITKDVKIGNKTKTIFGYVNHDIKSEVSRIRSQSK